MNSAKMDAKRLLSVELRMYFIAIIAVWQHIGFADCQGDNGIRFSLGNREIPNHGLLATWQLGASGINPNLSEGLACTYPSGSRGNWKRPDGVDVRDVSTDVFQRRRDDDTNTVYLFRNIERSQLYAMYGDGIWRCQTSNNTKFIGIYTDISNGMLSHGTPNGIQFSSSSNPVRFTLTFNTTGGPASYVTWTRDGVNISTPEDNRFVASQMVERYTDGNYSNTLTVTGRLPGEYGVTVTNDVTTISLTPTAVTVLDFSHPNFSVNQSEDLRSIIVSWNLNQNDRLSLNYLTGFSVQYTCSHDSCGSGNIVNITESSATHYILSDVTLWTAYSITFLAHFNQPHSDQSFYILPGVQGPVYRTIETKGVTSPAITSVSELANITSVRVTWEQPEGGVAVDEYVVTYHRLNGINGQCESFQDGNSIIQQNSMGHQEAVFLHIHAFSVYVVSVTGRKGDLLNSSANVHFLTNTTVPSGAPQSLTIINFTSTNVTISWDSVECIHRNGLITHYIISYGPESGPVKNVTVNISEPNDGGRYTATGLDPAVSYVFKVATVNDVGVGVFASKTLQRQGQASQNTGGIAAAVVVTVVLVLILAGAIVGAFFIATRVNRVKAKAEAAHKPDQVIYEEPDFPPLNTVTEELKMETCPAYDVSIVKQS